MIVAEVCQNITRGAGEYDVCLEEEYVTQTLHLMNCTPPWMTDNEDVWCGAGLEVTPAQDTRINYHLGQYTTHQGFYSSKVQDRTRPKHLPSLTPLQTPNTQHLLPEKLHYAGLNVLLACLYNCLLYLPTLKWTVC